MCSVDCVTYQLYDNTRYTMLNFTIGDSFVDPRSTMLNFKTDDSFVDPRYTMLNFTTGDSVC